MIERLALVAACTLVCAPVASARVLKLTRDNPTTDVTSCAVKLRVRYPGPGARWRVQGSNCVVTRPTTGNFSVAFDPDCEGHRQPMPANDAGYSFANRVITMRPGQTALPHWHGVIYRWVEKREVIASWVEEDGFHAISRVVGRERRPVDCVVAVFKDMTPGSTSFPDGTPVHNNIEIVDWGYFPRDLPPVLVPRANSISEEGIS